MELLKFFRVVVGWRNVPVEVVLVEDGLDVVVVDERELFRIERADELRRKIFFKSLFLSNRENQLHEAFVDVVACSLLGFRPQKRL